MKKWLPLILTGVMAAWFLSTLRAPAQKDFDYQAFGKLPLVFNGRFQPMDSVARNSLLIIREKQSVYLADQKRKMPAIEWLANVSMNPTVADQLKVFRIDHPDLISQLKLPEKGEAGSDGKHFSWAQIQPSLDVMDRESKRVQERERKKESTAGERTPFERAVMKTHNRLVLYMRLKNMVQPQDARDWAAELAEFETLVEPGLAAARAQQANQPFDEVMFDRFIGMVQKFDMMARFEPPLVIPPTDHGDHSHDNWSRSGEALLESARGASIAPTLRQYATMATAFTKGDVATFNDQVAAFRDTLPADVKSRLGKVDAEGFYNRMQPFYAALTIYVLAFLLACASWFRMSDALRRSAAWLIVLGFVIHTAGLIFRMWLEGRPPVTNLYSSAIFIGWGSVILGMVLEKFYKDGIGSVVASAVGFLTLIIAHNLSLGGDTMEMMRAVLDTNFWLATHVVIVTLGYASTFVAGFLALIFVVRGLFTRTLDAGTARGLTRMVYGIVCFATLFSFIGTVLGGIWADQSWGRFWGWDPKENGALIIVLWNALILHARWGGLVRERGLMNMAIFGNIVTAWSWFGTNMLGIGLHSYGFMDAAFKWLMAFNASQIVLMLLGMLPPRFWRSGASLAQTPPGSPGSRGGKSGKLAPAT